MKEIMVKVYESKIFLIKDCPFCSSDMVGIGVNRQEDLNKSFYELYFVHCSSCGARSPIHSNCNQSVEEWNSIPQIQNQYSKES